MRNLRVIINEGHEIFEIGNLFEISEMKKYMGVLLEQKTPFTFDGEIITVLDEIKIQKLTINGLFPYLLSPTIIANNIQMLMGVQAKVNHDNNIDVVKTSFKRVGEICKKFDLELNHAYNGLSGEDFELNIKG